MITYTIWIDDQPYRGEGEATEPAPPLSGGWYDTGPERVNGIVVGGGEPHRIEGRRNLQSHMDRVLRRLGSNGFNPSEIMVRVHGLKRDGYCQQCEHPTWDSSKCPNCGKEN